MAESSNQNLQNQPVSDSSADNNYGDDCEYSDGTLRYIEQMLMEEEIDEQTHMLQESLDLQAKERSFYELLGQKYPLSPTLDYDVYLRKGFDDASKFLPSGNKNRHAGETDTEEEERSKKVAGVYTEFNDVPKEEFDYVVLTTVGELKKKFEAYRANLLEAGSKTRRRGCGTVKKQRNKEETIDLRSHLIECAQLITAGDDQAANECLKQIRTHSSPLGDGLQRLAHYFANGLEARLAGTGSHIHKALLSKRITASDYLRAYYTYTASCPFHKVSIFAFNMSILLKSEKAMTVHFLDFGILYGFRWPSFIQSLAEREGGPPKLRITGIDFPQPGFRPGERVEETGRRLARYAEMFNVPFEFKAITQKWETIKIEDLMIEEGEFVAVICMFRAQYLPDETFTEESSRTMVLNLIRKINPDIFIHGIVNVNYTMPLFLSRFREALYHYSAMYDMVEATIPREKPERLLIERDLIGSEALNLIACEGCERVERGETYKLWQVRHLKAGFMQVPFEREVIDRAKYMFSKFYHREFVIDETNEWILMGWKGRTLYALSCWQPV
ncbi:hypothetical protein CASFOL_033353 [Castilleja foliolosa]|uniref:Scarecrow-like protein 9 n=1 Tax=Castilleja foliolosa TaxID=1961234 RepID=A0ABD3BZ14_9LAMI